MPGLKFLGTGMQQLTYGTILVVSLPFVSDLVPRQTHKIPYSTKREYDSGFQDYYRSNTGLSNEVGQLKVLEEFATKLLSNTKELDGEIAAAISRNFWELYEPL